MRWHRGRPIPQSYSERNDIRWLVQALITMRCPDDELVLGVLRWTGGVGDPAVIQEIVSQVKENPPYRRVMALENIGYTSPTAIQCPQCSGVLQVDGTNRDGTLSFVICTDECRYCWVIANKPRSAL